MSNGIPLTAGLREVLQDVTLDGDTLRLPAIAMKRWHSRLESCPEHLRRDWAIELVALARKMAHDAPCNAEIAVAQLCDLATTLLAARANPDDRHRQAANFLGQIRR